MTYEEFYGKENYIKLLSAEQHLEALAKDLKNITVAEEDLTPVVYYCLRIKKPESMTKKLAERGFPVSAVSALTNVYDALGLRIICSFESDVQYIVGLLENEKMLTVTQKKDYLSYPKPNGYRSIHLCCAIKESGVLCEIQVRTIAMDFWATLEHQIRYKKEIKSEELIISELKRCADEIASVDLSMQTIREIIASQ